ncbi:hypothetical protein Pelo_5664 [Pelomyxa schiedti]|nr:hypothetical protein Pelo_5664 [Pelomyxa schiedti]
MVSAGEWPSQYVDIPPQTFIVPRGATSTTSRTGGAVSATKGGTLTIYSSKYSLKFNNCALLQKADNRDYDLNKSDLCSWIKRKPRDPRPKQLAEVFCQEIVEILLTHKCGHTVEVGSVPKTALKTGEHFTAKNTLEVVGIFFEADPTPTWWTKASLVDGDSSGATTRTSATVSDKQPLDLDAVRGLLNDYLALVDEYSTLVDERLFSFTSNQASHPPKISKPPKTCRSLDLALKHTKITADSATGDVYISHMYITEKNMKEGRIFKYSKKENILHTIPERRGNTLTPPAEISSSSCIPLNDAIFVHPTCMSHWRDLLAVVDNHTPCVQLIDFSAAQVFVYFNATMGPAMSITVKPPEVGRSMPEIHVGTKNGIWVIKPTWQENSTWNFTQVRKLPRGVDGFYGFDIVISLPDFEINGTSYQWMTQSIPTVVVVNLRIWRPECEDQTVLVYAVRQPTKFKLVCAPIDSPAAPPPPVQQEPSEGGVAQQPANKRARTPTSTNVSTASSGSDMRTSQVTKLPKLKTNEFLEEEFTNMLDFHIDTHKNVLYVLCGGSIHIFEAPFTNTLSTAEAVDIPPFLEPQQPTSTNTLSAATVCDISPKIQQHP